MNLSEEADAEMAQAEIRGAVEYHHEEGLVESRDRRMLGGVLDLAEMDVTEVMVHRKNIVMLDADRRRARDRAEALDARTPACRSIGRAENIVGVLHAKDLARAISGRAPVDTIDIPAVAREPWFIPDTTNLKDQLNAFLRSATTSP